MGVSVSKPESSGPETAVPGQVYERGGRDSVDRAGECQESPNDRNSEVVFPAPLGQENQALQMLCADDDDDRNSDEWNEIYHRLKTDSNADHHVANTRFASSRLTMADDNPKASRRDRRGTDASMCPKAVTNDVTAGNQSSNIGHRPTSNHKCGTIITADENCKRDNGSSVHEIHVHESMEPTRADIDDILKATEETPGDKGAKRVGNSPCLLTVPAHVSSPMHYANKRDRLRSDSDPDPVEGIPIPRNRKNSFGSESVQSMKVNLNVNNIQKIYYDEIKLAIGSYGYFDKFPTPSVLKDAQRAYRRMHIPVPTDQEGNTLPHPPMLTKREVFSSCRVSFDTVDSRILHAPAELTEGGDPADIALYLCEGLDKGDDLSKVRAISTWLAVRQINIAIGGKPRSEAPEFWCQLYRSLCRHCRVKTQLIRGVVRGPGFMPGDDLDKHRGCWVAVLVSNDWWVVDPVLKQDQFHLAKPSSPDLRSGSLFQHAESFFQDPEVFIYTHFPDVVYWQLLARPVAREEYKELPVLRPGFFDFNLKMFNLPTAVMTVTSEMKLINISYPENSKREFVYKFYYCGNDILENEIYISRSKKVSLQRFVFMETKLDMNSVNIQVRFPRKGPYILDLSTLSETKQLCGCCTFKFIYDHSKSSSPLPQTAREEWGPGHDTLRIGLTPISHKSGEIIMDKSVLQVVFSDQRGLQFQQELRQDNNKADPHSARVSFLRDKNSDILFIVDIDSVVTGTFVLLLYARSDTSKPFVNFCNYLIKKLVHKRPIEIEEMEKRTITPKYHFLPRQTSDEEKVPLIAPDSGTLQLNFKAQDMSNIKVELKLHDIQEINFSEHARIWLDGDKIFVDLNFPRKGKYFVRVVGRTGQEKHVKTLFNNDIIVNMPSAQWSPFPKVESWWDSSYKIETPLTHHLAEKTDIEYSVRISGAHDVAVLSPGGWYHLEHVKNDLWQGQAWSGPRDTRCRLLARFQAGSERFSELLLFKVTSEESFKSLTERQERMRTVALNSLKDSRLKT